MKTSITAAEARQDKGYVAAFTPEHRAMKKELARRDIRWDGVSPAKEATEARRRIR